MSGDRRKCLSVINQSISQAFIYILFIFLVRNAARCSFTIKLKRNTGEKIQERGDSKQLIKKHNT